MFLKMSGVQVVCFNLESEEKNIGGLGGKCAWGMSKNS